MLGAGRHQTRLVTIGALVGGNVRVGLEDSIYLAQAACSPKSNAAQVAKIVRILRELSLEPATPDRRPRDARAQGRRRDDDRRGERLSAPHRRPQVLASAGNSWANAARAATTSRLRRPTSLGPEVELAVAPAGLELGGDRGHERRADGEARALEPVRRARRRRRRRRVDGAVEQRDLRRASAK